MDTKLLGVGGADAAREIRVCISSGAECLQGRRIDPAWVQMALGATSRAAIAWPYSPRRPGQALTEILLHVAAQQGNRGFAT